ncbi:MAG: response regulator, partial [Rhodospirillales bacterium]
MASGKSLLIVDDDEMLRHSLVEQLQDQDDFDAISEASTGAEAIQIAKDKVFDVIVLDLELPDMDGRDVCRTLRESGVRSPIIMLTAAD